MAECDDRGLMAAAGIGAANHGGGWIIILASQGSISGARDNGRGFAAPAAQGDREPSATPSPRSTQGRRRPRDREPAGDRRT